MSKRLIRVLPHEIRDNQSELQKHVINAVLSNGNTLFGRLQAADNTGIVLKDTRDHLHQIALSELYELVYDDARGIVPKSRHPTI
ncbi:hypothetical protein GCM10010967_12660 [Dyadobacter beijingensis]|uniref:Uncharacterized protein n=1 Tax=Dyadobacter beijingensis TaxID=365489 RepID=A0ABQ2HK66_9BACT|nr:hypothetical protein [Dyadobacter beijingensis]GGM82453.1 hypothetical protein GCM10010967_12660 [Dyadobacter beijingensis]